MDFDVTGVVVALLTLLSGVALFYVIKYVNILKANNNWALEYFIEALCIAAEKWFDGPGMGSEKLAWVLDLVEKECESRGIGFDAVAVADVIEKFVHDVINGADNDPNTLK